MEKLLKAHIHCSVNPELKHLNKLKFALGGQMDVLPVVATALSFIIDKAPELQKIEGSEEVYGCSHCVRAMMSFLNQIDAIIADGVEHNTNHLQ